MNASSHDVIIVGSGAGGSAAAHRLVRAGLRVLLLEKGSWLPCDGSTLDVQRVVHAGEFLAREPWQDGRGRRFAPEEHFNVGGKTKWYGAALLRFGTHEFSAEASFGCRGWPLRAEELTPYYDEAEGLLGVRSFDCEPNLAQLVQRLARVSPGWRVDPLPLALSEQILGDAHEASHFDGFASVAGLKGEADRCLLRPLLKDPRFTLLTSAEVHSLVAATQSPAAVGGVRLRDGRTFHAPYVLLAAGALHSPRILSRFLAETGLAGVLPGARQVGRDLKLHLLTAMVALGASTRSDALRKTVLLTHPRFPHSSVQPLGFDGELIATLLPRLLPRGLRAALGARAYGFFLQTEDGSHEDNRVVDAEDPGSPPLLDYDEHRTPAAAHEHRAFTRAFQGALLRTGMAPFARRIGLAGTAHACGTLACGSRPEESVVDASGRVHGIAGLYVVDGSVLPRSSRVNPALTIYAWALRVADLLARRIRTDQIAVPMAAEEVSHAS